MIKEQFSELAVSMYEQGMSIRSVAKCLECSPSKVHTVLREADVMMRESSIPADDIEWEIQRARIIKDAKTKYANAHAIHKRLSAGAYDTAAVRVARDDVRRAMKQAKEVPSHFGYVNVFGAMATQVML
jgi:uncharacterized protein YfcZ (UPF0381/DUF406 family)